MNFKTLSATALMTGLVTMGAFAQNAMPAKSTASAPVPAKAQTVTDGKAAVKASSASTPVVQPTLEELKANTEKAKKELAAAEAAKKAKPAASAK